MVRLCKILAVLLLAGLLFTTCDMDMGLGPQVDLTAPILTVTHIIRPDGTEQELEEGEKLFVGPGLLVGAGFKLKGTALDNVRVEKILVEEVGSNAELINGQNPTWSDATITKSTRQGELQIWEISLSDPPLKNGERVIRVTALDKAGNIGPETVKEYTLLVDTNPPFVDNVKVERRPGLQVDLLPKASFDKLDDTKFDHIDYFQNETFSIRAAIDHEFSLSNVWLNFIDETGKEVFAQGLPFTSGTLYAPVWVITADQLIAANPIYASGKHYLNVAVTAQAEAGHTGTNEDLTNIRYNICWYPEADIPRISPGGELATETGGLVLVNVFDDDNLGEVYAGMVTKQRWEEYKPELTDEQKLEWLLTAANRYTFETDRTDNDETRYPLRVSKLSGKLRSTVVGVDAGLARGEYRMVVLAQDVKEDAGRQQRWKTELFTVTVTESGSPVITITGPAEKTAAVLTGGTSFTITGQVLDISEVRSLEMVWIPAGLNLSAAAMDAEGRKALDPETRAAALEKGIKYYNLTDGLGEFRQQTGSKYSSQTFSKELNIFEDFLFGGDIENETKLFMFRAVGMTGETDTLSYELYGYKQTPVIEIDSPLSYEEFGPGQSINFEITTYSRLGVALERPTMVWEEYVNEDGQSNRIKREGEPDEFLTLPLDLEDAGIRLDADDHPRGEGYNATDSQTPKGEYTYRVFLKDKLGNEAQQKVTIQIGEVPNLERIQTINNPSTTEKNTWYATGDDITIQAVFSGTVSNVNTYNDTRIPYIRLGGITNPDSNVLHRANYSTGAGSNTLTFVYKVQANDTTTAGGIQALAIELNGANISVDDISFTGKVNELAAPNPAKTLFVDGVAPYITAVALSVTGYDNEYFNATNGGWIRAGATIQAEVTMSKPVKVMGAPNLILNLFNETGTTLADIGNRRANYTGTAPGSGDTILVFQYTVRENVQTSARTTNGSALTVNRATCFSDAHLKAILDTVGSVGNVLRPVTGTTTSGPAIRVDSVRPDILTIDTFTGTRPASLANHREVFRATTTGAWEELEISGVPTYKVQYTEDGGSNWLPVTVSGTNRLFGIVEPKTYRLQARQVDRAGNVSLLPDPIPRDLTTVCDLIAIVCDSADGYHTNGTTANPNVMVFKMVFSGRVIFTGANRPSITLAGGDAPTTVPAGTFTDDIVLTAISTNPGTAVGANNGLDTLEFRWNIPEGRRMSPVRITSVSIAGVRHNTDNTHTVRNIIEPVGGDSLKRPNLRVLSIRPTINTWGANANGGNTTEATRPITTDFVLSPSNTTTTQTQLRLNFSHTVWPEKGYIVLRPADGWHIPPVLTNDEFSAVLNALDKADQDLLNEYYTRTTHGLVQATKDGQNRYVPDISTKYVLNFSVGIISTTANSNEQILRNLFEKAKYLWQEIEVVNPTLVTNASGNSILESGSAIIRVNFNRLPDGRQWRVGIEGGSFRDEAGNTFRGWQWQLNTNENGTGAGVWAWNTTANRFWSERVAVPVIRVERVSNNSVTLNPRNNTVNWADFANRGRKGTPNEQTSRVNVRYRIDCVTPGATINYGTWEGGSATVPAWNNSGTSTIADMLTYGANSNTNSPANSNLLDATTAQMGNIGIGTTANNSTTGIVGPIGDTELYTARKDYVAAQATRTNLTTSARGYEGAFKTVIVYRNTKHGVSGNPPYEVTQAVANSGNLTNRAVKIEAVNQRNGPISIAGFPMDYNDDTGKSSKHLYDNRSSRTANPAVGGDRIWISWEMVSDFWQVGMLVQNENPNTSFAWNNAEANWTDENPNPWRWFPGDWQRHNYRRYGNWGLRVGNHYDRDVVVN
jgi:hypothetical protein